MRQLDPVRNGAHPIQYEIPRAEQTIFFGIEGNKTHRRSFVPARTNPRAFEHDSEAACVIVGARTIRYAIVVRRHNCELSLLARWQGQRHHIPVATLET